MLESSSNCSTLYLLLSAGCFFNCPAELNFSKTFYKFEGEKSSSYRFKKNCKNFCCLFYLFSEAYLKSSLLKVDSKYIESWCWTFFASLKEKRFLKIAKRTRGSWASKYFVSERFRISFKFLLPIFIFFKDLKVVRIEFWLFLFDFIFFFSLLVNPSTFYPYW